MITSSQVRYFTDASSDKFRPSRDAPLYRARETWSIDSIIKLVLLIMSPSTSNSFDGSGWSASLYNKHASFVYSPAFTSAVLELLAAQPGERIIDFGCGSGEVTLEIKKRVEEAPGGVVVAVDFSESMIAQARANGLEYAFVSDIQALKLPNDVSPLAEKFDAVFTNAALHWCKANPTGVLESVKKVLKKGGRFTGETGGFMNCIGLRSAIYQVLKSRGHDPVLHDPWYFPSPDDYRKLLVAASFDPVHLSLNPRFTPLPGGLRGWLQTFTRHTVFADFSDEETEEMMEEVEKICRVDCQDENGNWAIMYVRLRFSAILV